MTHPSSKNAENIHKPINNSAAAFIWRRAEGEINTLYSFTTTLQCLDWADRGYGVYTQDYLMFTPTRDTLGVEYCSSGGGGGGGGACLSLMDRGRGTPSKCGESHPVPQLEGTCKFHHQSLKAFLRLSLSN